MNFHNQKQAAVLWEIVAVKWILGGKNNTLHNCVRRDARGRDLAAGLQDHMDSPAELAKTKYSTKTLI